MPRYIDTRYFFKCETCRHYTEGQGCNTFCDSGECYSPNMNKIPTADVVLREQETLHHLKRDLHEKAIYPHGKGIDSYILLKVVDAIINNYLRELEEKR